MTTEYMTIEEINERIKNNLQPISELLVTLFSMKDKLPKERKTYSEVKSYAEFTKTSLECLVLLDEGNKLFEKAAFIAVKHFESKDYDKFKEDKKQLRELDETYEQHKYLFGVYSKLIDAVEDI